MNTLLKVLILVATFTLTQQAVAEESEATDFDYAPKYINQYEVIRSPYYDAADSDGLLPSLDAPAPVAPKVATRFVASIKAPKAAKKPSSKLASKAKSKAKAKSAKSAKIAKKSKSHPKRKVASRLERKPFNVEAHASRVARPDFLYRASPEQAPELQYH
jgi:hypothetical protein